MSGSAARARRLYGLVLPRDRWVTRTVLRLVDAWYGLRGQAYRAHAHPNARIDELAAAAGLRLRGRDRDIRLAGGRVRAVRPAFLTLCRPIPRGGILRP